jgi:hypothetical protein
VLKVEKAPQYPAILQQMHLKGAVQLKAVVRADGLLKKYTFSAGCPSCQTMALRGKW